MKVEVIKIPKIAPGDTEALAKALGLSGEIKEKLEQLAQKSGIINLKPKDDTRGD